MDCSSSTAGCKLALALAALLVLAACTSSSPLPSLGLVPDFTLTDQAEHEFRSADALKRKVWIADFIFTHCPGPCPRMTSLLRKVEDQLSDEPDVRFVSFTVDPSRDTPQVLADYARQFKVREGQWFFLTGTEQALNQLSQHAFKLGDVDGKLEHSTRFVIVDKFGRIRAYYTTQSLEVVPQIVADARALLKEKF